MYTIVGLGFETLLHTLSPSPVICLARFILLCGLRAITHERDLPCVYLKDSGRWVPSNKKKILHELVTHEFSKMNPDYFTKKKCEKSEFSNGILCNEEMKNCSLDIGLNLSMQLFLTNCCIQRGINFRDSNYYMHASCRCMTQ